MPTGDARAQLALPPDAAEYGHIRNLWRTHSLAEDRRDIPGLLATLTEDCRYEVVNTGHRWEGIDGARRFYTELLTAFPDVHFDLTNIVIGPQGVSEEARVTGTFRASWLGFVPTDELVRFNVVIFFPWDRAAGKFAGERIFVDWHEAPPQAAAS